MNKKQSSFIIEKAKDNFFKIIYLSIISFLIFNDYYIFTEIFHLRQATFLNYVLPSSIKEQWLILFILTPIFIGFLLIVIFKYQYDTLKTCEIDSPTKRIFLLDFILIFAGDVLVYFFLKLIIEQLHFTNLLLFAILLYLLYFFVNIRSYYFVFVLKKWLTYKIKNNARIQKFIKSAELIAFGSILVLFITIKLFLYYKFFSFMGTFLFFGIINLFVFLYIIIVIFANKFLAHNIINNKERLTTKERYLLSALFLFGVYLMSINLDQVDRMQYESRSFWIKKVERNDITKSQFSLILNPLKIARICDRTILDKINLTFNLYKNHIELQKNILTNFSKNKIYSSIYNRSYYLPVGKYHLVFLYGKNKSENKNEKECKEYILILFLSNNYSRVLDIGYINLK